MAQKEIIQVAGISDVIRKANAPISPAVRANGFVFVAGTPPIDPVAGEFIQGNIAEQTERALENLKLVLAESGSSLDKVVKVTIYISNAVYFDQVNAIYARYFPHDPPARSFVTVGSWPKPFDIEIDCIALA